jgi:GNAT superfamily N-acetyltransferase
MAQAAVSCRRLTSAGDPAFPAFLEIYTEALSERERKSTAAVEAMACRDDYLLLILESEGRVLGFSLIFLPSGQPFFLLEYMAIHHDHRGFGLGAVLFQKSLQTARALPGRASCLVEVDSPREPSPDQALRERRQRFYRRHGCLRLEGLDYLLPLPGEGAPPAMDLMVHAAEPLTAVPKAVVQGWLESLYREVYACAPGDRRIQDMLRVLGDPVHLI